MQTQPNQQSAPRHHRAATHRPPLSKNTPSPPKHPIKGAATHVTL